MDVEPNSRDFEPMTTTDFLTVKIRKATEQPNPFDNGETTNLNVEFEVLEPEEYQGRRTWRTFGPSWPVAEKKGSTLLFDLASAFDPEGAIKGKNYDTDRLEGKVGRILLKNKDKKDKNGNLKQQPEVFAPLKEGATAGAGTAKLGNSTKGVKL